MQIFRDKRFQLPERQIHKKKMTSSFKRSNKENPVRLSLSLSLSTKIAQYLLDEQQTRSKVNLSTDGFDSAGSTCCFRSIPKTKKKPFCICSTMDVFLRRNSYLHQTDNPVTDAAEIYNKHIQIPTKVSTLRWRENKLAYNFVYHLLRFATDTMIFVKRQVRQAFPS